MVGIHYFFVREKIFKIKMLTQIYYIIAYGYYYIVVEHRYTF